jgi:glycosidase
MLGGMSEFKNLIKDAKKKNIRIVVDCLARVNIYFIK